MKVRVALNVNGESREALVPVHKTLLEVLREDLGLTGTKHGCELGECGTCTVLVDGEPVLSCLALPVETEGCRITTVEGMAEGGKLHPLQQAFAELGAAQCGYCTPGILLTATASPTIRTFSAQRASSSCDTGRIPNFTRGRSAAVTTARTPGSARAREVSIERMRA